MLIFVNVRFDSYIRYHFISLSFILIVPTLHPHLSVVSGSSRTKNIPATFTLLHIEMKILSSTLPVCNYAIRRVYMWDDGLKINSCS